MSSPAAPTFGHPVTDFVTHARERLTDMAEQPLWSLSEDQRRRTLTQATYLQAQLDALVLRLALDADSNGVGVETGATSTAVWWAHRTRLTQRDAASRMKLAKALEQHPPSRWRSRSGRSSPTRPA